MVITKTILFRAYDWGEVAVWAWTYTGAEQEHGHELRTAA